MLAHFSRRTRRYQNMAEEAGWSRVLAGVQYPSDYHAGLALGRTVAEQDRCAAADGSSAVWSGSVPPGPCKWTGSNPGNVTATGWTPLYSVRSASSARRRPRRATVRRCRLKRRPCATSPHVHHQLQGRSTGRVRKGCSWPYRYADKWMFEEGLDRNPPRAARVCLIAAAMFDAFIASQDGKFTYCIFDHTTASVDHAALPGAELPSYLSNHSTLRHTRSEILAYLFPNHADFIRAVGKEAGDSRIWAGIHYQMDNVAAPTWGSRSPESSSSGRRPTARSSQRRCAGGSLQRPEGSAGRAKIPLTFARDAHPILTVCAPSTIGSASRLHHHVVLTSGRGTADENGDTRRHHGSTDVRTNSVYQRAHVRNRRSRATAGWPSMRTVALPDQGQAACHGSSCLRLALQAGPFLSSIDVDERAAQRQRAGRFDVDRAGRLDRNLRRLDSDRT